MTNILKLSFLVALLAGCSAAIDLPTPTPTAQTIATAEQPAQFATLSPTPQATRSAADICTVSTGVPAGYLNLRSGAGMQYPVIRVLREGEVLTVITRGEWHEVTDAQGNHGFINSNYCKG